MKVSGAIENFSQAKHGTRATHLPTLDCRLGIAHSHAHNIAFYINIDIIINMFIVFLQANRILQRQSPKVIILSL